jgi:hypothetical protein
MWHPPTGALYRVVDAIFNWYHGHNVLGPWFTTLGIGVWYYFIPKLINRPLYSHALSLISFFPWPSSIPELESITCTTVHKKLYYFERSLFESRSKDF